jgi:hypothetical protein
MTLVKNNNIFIGKYNVTFFNEAENINIKIINLNGI